MYKSHYVGKLGEDMAVTFLMKRGFDIVDRNYRRKTGEIDIVAKKDTTTHFFEVKSVTHETRLLKEGDSNGRYRPEDNVHGLKQKKLARTIQLYLLDKQKTTDVAWEFGVIAVSIDQLKKMAHVRLIPNIIL